MSYIHTLILFFSFFIYFYFYFFIFLNFLLFIFLAVLGLYCFVGFSLVAASGGYSLVGVHRLLIAVASLAEHGL